MKEIVTWCDPCLDLGFKNAGREHEVHVDSQKPALIDMCDTCAEAWLDPLRELLEKHGQPALTRPHVTTLQSHAHVEDGHVRCPFCTKTYASNSSGMREHLYAQHGIDQSKMLRGPCPICGFEVKRLGTHVNRAHPSITSAMGAYEWARDHDDPFGRYAGALAS
jgi:hypothetical protein